MNKKLLKVLDEIDKAEARLAEWQKHLDGLNGQREQLEEQEIVKAVRSLGLSGRRLAEAVDGLYSGRLTLAEIHSGGGGPDTGTKLDGSGDAEPVSGGRTGGFDEGDDKSDAGAQPDGCQNVEPASDFCREREAGMEKEN